MKYLHDKIGMLTVQAGLNTSIYICIHIYIKLVYLLVPHDSMSLGLVWIFSYSSERIFEKWFPGEQKRNQMFIQPKKT